MDSWVTDLATSQRLDAAPRVRWRGGAGAPGATIVVDPTRRYQTMVGFGASMTDSSAYVLSRDLSPRVRRQTMRDLFSPTEGIGLSMLRQPMGASDFAVGQAYSYDDQPAGQTDPDLSDFSIGHDQAYILPRLREALRLNPRMALMATPWSAPGWMKDSDSMITGSLLPAYHQAYADYFAHFIKAYQDAGIPTHYVSMQNEPLYEPVDYPGMRVFPDQAGAFIAGHLAPTLERAGLEDTKILGYDHNWDITDYPEAMYSDSRVAPHVAGTAWHCYAGEVVAQSVSHNNYPHAQAFQTECSGGDWQRLIGDPFELTMASVIGVPRNWGQSVVLWNLALDADHGPFIGGCTNCRGVVTVNSDGTVTKELDYWALGHASKFVQPGAVRIASSQHPTTQQAGGGRGLTNVAFRNPDGSSVLIAHNATARPLTFDIQVGHRHFPATLAAGAAATYRWTSPLRLKPVTVTRLGRPRLRPRTRRDTERTAHGQRRPRGGRRPRPGQGGQPVAGVLAALRRGARPAGPGQHRVAVGLAAVVVECGGAGATTQQHDRRQPRDPLEQRCRAECGHERDRRPRRSADVLRDRDGCRDQHRGLPPPLHRSGLRRRTGLDRHCDRAGTAEPDRGDGDRPSPDHGPASPPGQWGDLGQLVVDSRAQPADGHRISRSGAAGCRARAGHRTAPRWHLGRRLLQRRLNGRRGAMADRRLRVHLPAAAHGSRHIRPARQVTGHPTRRTRLSPWRGLGTASPTGDRSWPDTTSMIPAPPAG